jgi:hypothetical protein
MRLVAALTLFALLLLVFAGAALAQDMPAEEEPGWNLDIYPFADFDGDLVFDPDERLIKAGGHITYSTTVRTWDASSLPAKVKVPTGVRLIISGQGVKEHARYGCTTMTGTLHGPGRFRLYLPCGPANPVEFAYRQWITIVRKYPPDPF